MASDTKTNNKSAKPTTKTVASKKPTVKTDVKKKSTTKPVTEKVVAKKEIDNKNEFDFSIVKPVLKKRLRAPEYSFEEDFNVIRKNMLELHEVANNSQEDEDNFYDTFSRIITEATKGYLPAQDYLGYVFKKGLGDLIPENYDSSMGWQFLSGANGNSYTIQKLKIFFARSYEQVLELEDIEEIANKNGIGDNNYEFVLGKLFCDAMCDELGITIQSLAEKKPVFLPQSLKLVQTYENARSNSLARVIEYLRK